MENLIEAHKFMLRRYRTIIETEKFEDKNFLLSFCDTAQSLSNPDKLSRWVGYIQGILIERDVVNTEHERNVSRTIYKPIYEELGYDTTTVNVECLHPSKNGI